jgi:predicted membrane protein
MGFGVTALLFFVAVFAKSWVFLLIAIAAFAVCIVSQLLMRKQSTKASEPANGHAQI